MARPTKTLTPAQLVEVRPASVLATVAGCLALSLLGQFGFAAALGMNPGQLLRLVLASTLLPALRAILRASQAAWLRVAS